MASAPHHSKGIHLEEVIPFSRKWFETSAVILVKGNKIRETNSDFTPRIQKILDASDETNYERYGGDTRARLQVRPVFNLEYVRNTTNWNTAKHPNARSLKKSDKHQETTAKIHYERRGGDTRARLQVSQWTHEQLATVIVMLEHILTLPVSLQVCPLADLHGTKLDSFIDD